MLGGIPFVFILEMSLGDFCDPLACMGVPGYRRDRGHVSHLFLIMFNAIYVTCTNASARMLMNIMSTAIPRITGKR